MSLERQFRTLLIVVECVIVATVMLHLLSIRQMHLRGLIDENQRTVAQVAAYYDSYAESFHTTILQTASYDDELLALVSGFRPLYHFKTGIARNLDTMAGASSYLHSAYLRLHEPDIVYSTSFIRPLRMDEFPDPAPFLVEPRDPRGVHRMEPREARFAGGFVSVMSYVVDLPLLEENKSGTLVVNIDMAELTGAIRDKTGVGEEFELFLDTPAAAGGNQEPQTSKIVFRDLLGRLTATHLVVTSSGESQTLGWQLRLVRQVGLPEGALQWASEVLLYVVTALLVVLLFALTMVFLYRRMLRALLVSLDNMVWRGFLNSPSGRAPLERRLARSFRCGPGVVVTPVVVQLRRDARAATEQAALRIERACIDLALTHGMRQKVIVLDSGCVAAILAMPAALGEAERRIEQCSLEIYLAASAAVAAGRPFVVVGEAQGSFGQVPASVARARELAQYRLSTGKQVAFVERDMSPAVRVAYPRELEGAIVRSLLETDRSIDPPVDPSGLGSGDGPANPSGDDEALRRCIRDFLDVLCAPGAGLSDREIVEFVRTLCGAVAATLLAPQLRRSVSLPDRDGNYDDVADLERAVTASLLGVKRLVDQDGARGTAPWKHEIVRHMDEHFSEENLNLNYLADLFHRDRGAVSRAVRELTGLGITDYLKSRRLEKARELLISSDAPVEEVARRVGYHYAYYFIRVFKSAEGVTPGRYRQLHSPLGAAVRVSDPSRD
jgi:AraC-like DNA-binding protein